MDTVLQRLRERDEARETLLAHVEDVAEPRNIPFKTGRRTQWNKNCRWPIERILEPLESTSIHLIQAGLRRLVLHFPHEASKTPRSTNSIGVGARVRTDQGLHYLALQGEPGTDSRSGSIAEIWQYRIRRPQD